MWDAYKTVRINTPVQTLWRILMDVPNWPTWDVDLAKATLDTVPAVLSPATLNGAQGTLDMKFNQSFRFRLQNIRENEYVEYQTKLPGVTADWYWDISGADAAGFDLKMGVRFTGWATFAYRGLIGGKTMEAFDICTKNLKQLCETGKVDSPPEPQSK
ncbi:hypothetical protein BC831DRAFT_485422 [Entophlyctis helioformis]|nr:hypothetical protein BC831DRAFT_485422 [Entophlyctis helioformis]